MATVRSTGPEHEELIRRWECSECKEDSVSVFAPEYCSECGAEFTGIIDEFPIE